MSSLEFQGWFRTLTTHPRPQPWQEDLAGLATCRDRLIRIPTGLGKTQGILAVWSFHRIHRQDDQWPRRLIWCLPMRVLVEQTEQVAFEFAERIPKVHRPNVHVAMGGADAGEWFLYPERPAIIIGTQDMLLSRALNRGYASTRARWPTEFGLLNHDALWVMDEVQLMDVGLATSAQLQAFREQDSPKKLRPCHTWWMSATLQPNWLRSVDTAPVAVAGGQAGSQSPNFYAAWIQNPCEVPSADRNGSLWEVSKAVATAGFSLDDHRGLAARILEEHGKLADGKFGKVTLVVCNTVDRACETFSALQDAGRTEGLELVHSRFRPAEREAWRGRFLSRSACSSGTDRIIVATQVVEAGVDISAGCLITELAPWPSLVQRFGRCARYGGTGNVLVVDRWKPDPKKPGDERDQGSSAPYKRAELQSALETVQQLNDVGITALEQHEQKLTPEDRSRLYPYSPAHLLLRKEFDELFDTTPDLTGADLDISRFIRSGDDRDLQVFWIDIEKGPDDHQPHRKELCSVPFLRARDWLCGEGPRLRRGRRAWIWDWLDGNWTVATREVLLPGRIVCVSTDSGGYRLDHGFDAGSLEGVPPVAMPPIPKKIRELGAADSQQNKEVPGDCWKTIACHTEEVTREARRIASELGLPKELQDLLELAVLWHDWGKSHPAFQGAMRGEDRPESSDLAKAPDKSWRRGATMYRYLDDTETRPAFRHELASALGLFALLQDYGPRHDALLGPWSEILSSLGKTPAAHEPLPVPSPLIQRVIDCSAESFNLLIYLIASHHGKVRVALHAAPNDQDYVDRDGRGLPIRGIREGDRLPSVVLVPGEPPVPEVTLTLSPATIGLSEKTGISWRERSLSVIERHGPAGLAFLEALLRAADVRASRLPTSDPLLMSEARA